MTTQHMRSIETIIHPGRKHFVGNGFNVQSYISSQGNVSSERMDPFLLMDYNPPFKFEPTLGVRGVDVHPHKGFETVTIAYQGAVAHEDSAGHQGVIYPGDVQWMTAGEGILHKEFHDKSFSEKGGYFQMVQLWINLKAKDKKTPAKYQQITNDTINRYESENKDMLVEVIAGEFNGIQGSATTFSPIHLYNVTLKSGAKNIFSFPNHFNTALLVLNGSLNINNSTVLANNEMAIFSNTGSSFNVEAESDSKILILSGEPLHESIVQHGPFVMNKPEEIYEAIRDFNLGKFGYLD